MNLDQLNRNLTAKQACYFYKEEEELLKHLLFHCLKSWSLLSLLLNAFHVKWVTPWLGRDFIRCWNRIPLAKLDRKILMWAFW